LQNLLARDGINITEHDIDGLEEGVAISLARHIEVSFAFHHVGRILHSEKEVKPSLTT
jgi:hypothetical protein